MGFMPFPGTLNLQIAPEKIPQIEALIQKNGVALMSPGSDSCAGHLYPVSIMGVSGAIFSSADNNSVHGKDVIELIAAACLKDALDVDEGDEVLFVAKDPPDS